MKRPLTPAELDRLFSRNDSRNSRKPPTARKKGAGVGPRELEARRVREEMAAKGKG